MMPDDPETHTPSQSDQVLPREASDDLEVDEAETLPVAPPSFRERLLAAQRARNTEIRPSVEIPAPGSRPPGVEKTRRMLDKAIPSEVQTTAPDSSPKGDADVDSLNVAPKQ